MRYIRNKSQIHLRCFASLFLSTDLPVGGATSKLLSHSISCFLKYIQEKVRTESNKVGFLLTVGELHLNCMVLFLTSFIYLFFNIFFWVLFVLEFESFHLD